MSAFVSMATTHLQLGDDLLLVVLVLNRRRCDHRRGGGRSRGIGGRPPQLHQGFGQVGVVLHLEEINT